MTTGLTRKEYESLVPLDNPFRGSELDKHFVQAGKDLDLEYPKSAADARHEIIQRGYFCTENQLLHLVRTKAVSPKRVGRYFIWEKRQIDEVCEMMEDEYGFNSLGYMCSELGIRVFDYYIALRAERLRVYEEFGSAYMGSWDELEMHVQRENYGKPAEIRFTLRDEERRKLEQEVKGTKKGKK